MKLVDVTKQMLNIEGSPLLIGDEKKQIIMTLKHVLIEALLHPQADTPEATGAQKLRKFLLAQSIHAATAPLELGDDDLKLIEEGLPKVYHVLIAGQAMNLLRKG